MFTRAADEPSIDVDSFFWRQVVAQSPIERKAGTPYDDGWRATNRILLNDGAQAQHERNVLLRNDGRGGFDDVSGTRGLDVDQDGRAFSVFDYDGDGDPTSCCWPRAPRRSSGSSATTSGRATPRSRCGSPGRRATATPSARA